MAAEVEYGWLHDSGVFDLNNYRMNAHGADPQDPAVKCLQGEGKIPLEFRYREVEDD